MFKWLKRRINYDDSGSDLSSNEEKCNIENEYVLEGGFSSTEENGEMKTDEIENEYILKENECIVSLSNLNDLLRKLFEQDVLSFREFKKLVKERGICLRNFVEYGSVSKLRRAMLNNPNLRINKRDAKKYKFVSTCLVYSR